MRSKKQLPPATAESVWAFLQEAAKEVLKELKEERQELKKERQEIKKENEKMREEAEKDRKRKEEEVEKDRKRKEEEAEKDRKRKEEEAEKDRKRKEEEAEKDRKRKEEEAEKEWKQREKEIKALDARLEKMYAESRKERKELNQQLGGISNSNGEMAETYFYNALKRDKTFVNEKFDSIKRNRKFVNNEIEAEFDIILFNGKSAAIIEVKYNAKPDNISVRRIVSRVEAFKLLYPDYKNHNIYLGVAAMTFRKGLEQRLHRAGIATIRQVGKKMVVYDKEVKVF